jgi:chromosome segregation ATPase
MEKELIVPCAIGASWLCLAAGGFLVKGTYTTTQQLKEAVPSIQKELESVSRRLDDTKADIASKINDEQQSIAEVLKLIQKTDDKQADILREHSTKIAVLQQAFDTSHTNQLEMAKDIKELVGLQHEIKAKFSMLELVPE